MKTNKRKKATKTVKKKRKKRQRTYPPTPDKPGEGWIELEPVKGHRVYVHKTHHHFKAFIGNNFTRQAYSFNGIRGKINKVEVEKAAGVEIPKGTPVVFRQLQSGPWQAGTLEGKETVTDEYSKKSHSFFVIKPKKKGAEKIRIKDRWGLDVYFGTPQQASEMENLRKTEKLAEKKLQKMENRLTRFDPSPENMVKLRSAAQRMIRKVAKK